MTRKLAVVLVLAGAMAWCAVVTAEQQAVVMKNGGRIVGEITRTSTGYHVKTATGDFDVAESDVVRVEVVRPREDEYKERLAKADPNNADQLYEVAKWAADNNMLVQARDLLNKVLELKPQHEDARLQLRLIEPKLTAATRTTTEGTAPETVKPTPGPSASDQDLLRTMMPTEDIYRLRLRELKANDSVQIDFRNKLIDRFLKANRGTGPFAEAGAEQEFLKLSRVAQARYILENIDRDNWAMLDDILVKSDPVVFRDFKTRIWPILAQTCASSACHGGVKGAGDLKLFNVAMGDERILYTNFYILHSYARGGQMIDRANPENSLLLECGLPKKLARTPHSKEINPVFPTRDDNNYRIILNWITTLRHPLLPEDYGVKYKVPGQPESAPSTEPAE